MSEPSNQPRAKRVRSGNPIRRSGRASPVLGWIVGSAALLLMLVFWMLRKEAPSKVAEPAASDSPAAALATSTEPLLVYCAASQKAPLEAVIAAYEKECGRKVTAQFGGSQTLLANVKVTGIGDLYLPADASYIELAQQDKLLAETLPLATMRPVLVVRKDNPLQIGSLDSLVNSEAKIAQADPDVAAIGKVLRDTLQPLHKWQSLADKTIVFKPTVTDVANDLKLGSVDAGFIWDNMLPLYPELQVVPLPELADVRSKVVLGVLAKSQQAAAARHFARYVAASDRGLPEFAKTGMTVVDGSPWVDSPVASATTQP